MPTRPKQWQAIFWIAAVVVVGGLATSAERYRRQVKKLEGLIQVKEFQHQLNVPSEVIYCRATAPRAVVEARMRVWEMYGTTTFLPYDNVIRPGSKLYHDGQLEGPAADFLTIANGSFENNSHDNARKACATLLAEIRANRLAGRYLRQYPKEFDRLIRPSLIRLLDAYELWLRLGACRVLLEMGDRDPRLQRIIEISMAHPNGWKMCVEIMDEYSLELQRLPQPETDYATDMDGVANWQQVHSIVQELKRDYPLVDGAAR